MTKQDYFGLGCGWTAQSTSENRSQGTASAQGSDGFTVAYQTFGDEKIAPTVEYIAGGTANLSQVVLGSTHQIDSKTIALGNVSISTRAGEAATMTATGTQIDANGTPDCTVSLGSVINIDYPFHANDFGLFTVTGGQLTDSTVSFEADIATAEVDGDIKGSDLVGGRVTVSGTIVGVSDAGVIGRPTVTLKKVQNKDGVFTTPVTETNPNGDFPTYTFTAEFPLKADAHS